MSDFDARSRHLRRLILAGLEGGGRGHVGSSLSLVEILRVLYDHILNLRPQEPEWPQRDRCILSKGHGCLALYALLADHGFFPVERLRSFCRDGSLLGGHPERGKLPGVEASTGALGHGLSLGVGMALAARLRGESHRVVVIMGDGEINEGSVWEAAMCAAHHRLESLTAIIDYNKLQSYGPISRIMELEPLAAKWEAFGFGAATVDGHDVAALRTRLERLPIVAGRPSVVICDTVKGKGIPWAEGNPEWHHKSRFAPEELGAMYAAVG